jgi:hypothetical protein
LFARVYTYSQQSTPKKKKKKTKYAHCVHTILPRGVLIRHESQKPGKNWRTDLKTLNEEISWATSAEKCISRYKATAIDENPSFTECKTTNCKTSLCRETDTFFHKDWTICELACEMDLVLGISKFYFSTKLIYFITKSTFHRISSLESDRIFLQ